jgi:hypothetical protein
MPLLEQVPSTNGFHKAAETDAVEPSSKAICPTDGEVPGIQNIVQQPLNGTTTLHKNGAPIVRHPDDEAAFSPAQDVPLKDQLAFSPRKIRVITVGAGFSGLIVAHKLQHKYPELRGVIEHKIFEARHDIGGTWLVNTYPGVQCDVPSHIYVSPSSRPNHAIDSHRCNLPRN